MLLRQGVADPTRFQMADNFRTAMMINELGMKDASDIQAQVCGVVILQVIDSKSFESDLILIQVSFESFTLIGCTWCNAWTHEKFFTINCQKGHDSFPGCLSNKPKSHVLFGYA